jgi:small subunit ribosomal protein S15
MALSRDEALAIVGKFGRNEKDSGSTTVQVAILTARIKGLTEHCKTYKKDAGARRGLLTLVSKRRRMLNYLQRSNLDSYRALLKELGLRK